jgi:hypothetical protein
VDELIMIDYQEFDNALKDVIDYLYPWEKPARRDFEFYALKQWEDDDIKKMDEEKRPALTFDRTRPIIDSVAGAEVTNRYEPKFLPREPDLEKPDVTASEVASEVYRYIRQLANTEHYESQAFRSALICGVGVTETFMNYELHPDGAIFTRRVPVFEMGWDPSSVDMNMADARYIIRDRWIPYDELASLFGVNAAKRVVELAKATSMKTSNAPRGLFGRMMTREIEDSRNAYMDKKGRKYYDPRTRHVRLWEMQRKEKRYMTRAFIPPELSGTGQPREEFITKGQTNQRLQELHEAAAVINSIPDRMDPMTGEPLPPVEMNYVKDYPVLKLFRSFHTGQEVLKEDELPFRDFTYQFITCFEDWSQEERRYFFGMMRPMRDPQQYANKFFSQAVHVWSSNPKGALLYEEDLFEDKETAMREWAKPTGMVPVPTGALSQTPKEKFKQLTSSQGLGGVRELLAHSQEAVPMAAGINENYFVGGAQDLRRTPASSIESVQRQNLVTISQPFDSLRMYKKTQAKLILGFIQEYMDEQEIMRIVGPEDAEIIPAVANGQLIDQYDIVIEESPTSQDKQMEVFAKLNEHNFIPQLQEMGVPVPPAIAKYFPFPPDINQDFQTALEQNKQLMELNNTLQAVMLQIQLMQAQMQMQAGGAMMPPGEGEQPPPEEGM